MQNTGKIQKVFFILLPILCIFLSLGIGSYKIDPISIGKIILGKITRQDYGIDPLTINVFLKTRLPRIFAAALVGMALSLAGAVFQFLFRNPLASPYTLGVSNGAGFGAALAIVLSLGTVGIQFFAIGFGLLSVLLTFLLAMRQHHSTNTLILSGMLVGSFFASLVSFMKFVADPYEKLPQIVYWLMGSLNGSSMRKIITILPIYILMMGLIFLYRWKINVMSMGDAEARSFGIDVDKDRKIVIISAGILTALVVSISGIIGWVGIVVPHLARMIVGADFRKIYFASCSLGISYLVTIDNISRGISSQEIPIGVITGIVGAPVFLYFIYKRKVHWS